MKIFNTILTTICVLILFSVFFSPQEVSSDKYKMELYVRTPGNEDVKVRECEGTNSGINCEASYIYMNYLCFSKGTYYAKAVTYLNNKILSTSGWVALSNFCA